ncbi:MAG: LamG domain-containing protein [Deltaproteobacteria bacterium]|nr:LamG domain-containing protein [Deltaproteobacteria bacterium]
MKKQTLLVSLAIATSLWAGLGCSPNGGDDEPVVNGGGKAGKGGGGMGGGAGGKGGGAGGTSTSPGGSGGVISDGGASGQGGPVGGAVGDGLIGYWRFNEGSGTGVKDASGKGNNGTILAGSIQDSPLAANPKWIKGRSGQGLELNGKDEWVKVPASESINETSTNGGSVTMAAWVQVKSIDATGEDYNFIISRHEVGTAYELFGLGLVAGKVSTSIHFFPATGAQTVPVDGTWHHIAGTYDGITQVSYLDGLPQGSYDSGWPVAADNTPLIIGGNQNTDTVKEFWDGALDEVRLYNRPLTAQEIAALAAEPPAP